MTDEGFTVTGSGIHEYRLLALKGALKLEVLGMKRHGRSAATLVREEMGSKTRIKKDLLKEYEEWLKQRASSSDG